VVNFINVKRVNFTYGSLFSSYVLALNKLSYKKCVSKTLMKLTPEMNVENKMFSMHFSTKFSIKYSSSSRLCSFECDLYFKSWIRILWHENQTVNAKIEFYISKFFFSSYQIQKFEFWLFVVFFSLNLDYQMWRKNKTKAFFTLS